MADTPIYTLDLITLKTILDEIQCSSQLLEASATVPLSTLVAVIDQDQAQRDRTIDFSFIPLPDDAFPDVKLLQFYTELPLELPVTIPIEPFLLAVNLTLPLGNFGVTDDRCICLRYSHALPKYAVLSEFKAVLIEVLKLFFYALDASSELIEQVAAGQISLEQAIAELHA